MSRGCRAPGLIHLVKPEIFVHSPYYGFRLSKRIRFGRECPAIEVDTSITGARVVAVLERLADVRGLPASITVDHGPEFEGKALDAWAYARGVRLSFISPGKPIENAYIESFNGRFRDECLIHS